MKNPQWGMITYNQTSALPLPAAVHLYSFRAICICSPEIWRNGRNMEFIGRRWQHEHRHGTICEFWIDKRDQKIFGE